MKDIDTNRPVILKFFDTVRAEELLEKAHVVICVADITDSDGCDTYLRSYWHVKSQNRGTIRHAYTLRTYKIHTFNTHTGGIPYISIGNKSDLDDIRLWSSKQARADCDCGDIPYIEVSASTGKNIKEAIRIVTDAALVWAKKYHVTYKTGDPYKDPEQNLVTEEDEQDELNGGCCIVS